MKKAIVKRMADNFKKIEDIRKKAETEGRSLTKEEIEERSGLLLSIENDKIELKSIEDEERTKLELFGPEGGSGPLSRSVDTVAAGDIEVPDAPIYRGSPASTLGMQLTDIAIISNPESHSRSNVSNARSRLEQTQKRYYAQLEKRAKEDGRQDDMHAMQRAAATGGFTLGVPSDSGFFLQGETSVELMTHGFNNSEVLQRCQQRTLGPGTQFVEIIGIDETSRENGSRGGGITVYTTEELAEYQASKTKFNKVRLEPTKLTGLYYASDEVMANVTFLGQEMRQLFGEEFAFKCQNLVVRGSGAGQALGILNSKAKIAQAAESGQAADTIVTDNILNMEAKLWREGPSVVYLVNRETKPQLSKLCIEVGVGGSLVPLYKTEYYQGVRQSTLNGIPCITIEQASALGDEGDIILTDLSQYLTVNRGDINEAMSIHVGFIYGQSTFRFTYFFEGQPRWRTSITPYKGASGAKVGPIITLAAR
jgi:HK97 family phage major capsid protein